MNTENLDNIADYLEISFENGYKGQKNCFLSERTCMILALEKYAENLDASQLQRDFSIKLNKADLKSLKKILLTRIEKYFADNIKTLALC